MPYHPKPGVHSHDILHTVWQEFCFFMLIQGNWGDTERLHENLALHGDLAAKIEAVGTAHTWEDSFFASNHQSTLEIEDSIQVFVCMCVCVCACVLLHDHIPCASMGAARSNTPPIANALRGRLNVPPGPGSKWDTFNPT